METAAGTASATRTEAPGTAALGGTDAAAGRAIGLVRSCRGCRRRRWRLDRSLLLTHRRRAGRRARCGAGSRRSNWGCPGLMHRRREGGRAMRGAVSCGGGWSVDWRRLVSAQQWRGCRNRKDRCDAPQCRNSCCHCNLPCALCWRGHWGFLGARESDAVPCNDRNRRSDNQGAVRLATASILEIPAGMLSAVCCSAASKIARARREPAECTVAGMTPTKAETAAAADRGTDATAEVGGSAEPKCLAPR